MLGTSICEFFIHSLVKLTPFTFLSKLQNQKKAFEALEELQEEDSAASILPSAKVFQRKETEDLTKLLLGVQHALFKIRC